MGYLRTVLKSETIWKLESGECKDKNDTHMLCFVVSFFFCVFLFSVFFGLVLAAGRNIEEHSICLSAERVGFYGGSDFTTIRHSTALGVFSNSRCTSDNNSKDKGQMSEDQFLIVAPKCMVPSLFGDGTNSGVGAGILNNDISLDLGKGLFLSFRRHPSPAHGRLRFFNHFNQNRRVTGSSGPRSETRRLQGEVRKLVNHMETWKTHDDINFIKSADVTHFLDFGDVTRACGDCLRQNELLR